MLYLMAVKVQALITRFVLLWGISDDEIKNMLENEGAAKEGGALHQVKEMVNEYGGGAVSISRDAFIYIVFIGLIIAAAGIIWYGNNPSKVGDSKTRVVYTVIGGVLGFGAVGAIIFMRTVGQNLF